MKPCIKKIHGYWYCGSRGRGGLGMGWTPSQAYRDWVAGCSAVAA